jgi:hypothetical protein
VRLDHLLSKECYRPSRELFSGVMSITTQLNTGYSGALVSPADEWPPLMNLVGAACSEHETVGARHSQIGPCESVRNSHYSVLREWPFGSFPVMSLRGSSEPGAGQCLRMESSPFGSSSSRRRSLLNLVVQVFRVPAVTTHPACALVGRFVPAASVLAYSTESGDGVPTLACAVQPLENSKASTSIFVLQATKSQR